jgi:hypothetical protein
MATNNALNNTEIPDSIFTTKGQIIGASGASTPVVLSSGASGYILSADPLEATGLKWIASTDTDEKVKYDAGDPVAGYLSAKTVAGTGITLAEGTGGDENKLKITNSAPGLTWIATADDTTMTVNYGYIPTDDAVRTVFTLPDTAAVGSMFKVVGEGDAGWKVAQNAGDTIRFGNVNTTTGAGGYIQSSDKGDCVEIVCIVANTDFRVTNAQGNITYV